MQPSQFDQDMLQICDLALKAGGINAHGAVARVLQNVAKLVTDQQAAEKK